MMSGAPDIAIAVEHLSKRFRVGERGGYRTLRDAIANGVLRLARPKPASRERRYHQALSDVSFTVERGEILGVIGANGAGKTTLLKILSRVTEPSAGRCAITGRIGSLLEVSTGFHPELTGRENVHVNGTLLGMTRREIRTKFDEIVAFSGIEPYIDTPVKRYSIGMQVRLGFAVAAFLDPEILLLDEVLAVGDVAFQRRCLGKMNEIASQGRTILFVSHNMEAISGMCSRAIWLENGRIREDGPSKSVVFRYLTEGFGDAGETMRWPSPELRRGSGRLRLTGCRIYNGNGVPASSVVMGDDLTIEVGFTAGPHSRDRLTIWLWVRSAEGRIVTTFHSRMTGRDFNNLPAQGKLRCRVPRFPLGPGSYSIALQATLGAETADDVDRAMVFEVMPGDFFGTGTSLSDKVEFLCKHEWEGEAAPSPLPSPPVALVGAGGVGADRM